MHWPGVIQDGNSGGSGSRRDLPQGLETSFGSRCREAERHEQTKGRREPGSWWTPAHQRSGEVAADRRRLLRRARVLQAARFE